MIDDSTYGYTSGGTLDETTEPTLIEAIDNAMELSDMEGTPVEDTVEAPTEAPSKPSCSSCEG